MIRFLWQRENGVQKPSCIQAPAQQIYDATCATDKVGTTLPMLYANPFQNDFYLQSRDIHQDLKTADFRGTPLQSVF